MSISNTTLEVTFTLEGKIAKIREEKQKGNRMKEQSLPIEI